MDAQAFETIICEIRTGTPLRRILDTLGVNPNVFYPALDSDEERAKRYARARLDSLDAMAEDMLAIADDDSVDPNARRVKVDTRKWLLSKLMPRKYGDNIDLSLGDGSRVIVIHSIAHSPLDAAPEPAAVAGETLSLGPPIP